MICLTPEVSLRGVDASASKKNGIQAKPLTSRRADVNISVKAEVTGSVTDRRPDMLYSVTRRKQSMKVAKSSAMIANLSIKRSSKLAARLMSKSIKPVASVVCPIGGNFLTSSGTYIIELNGRIFNVQVK